MPIDTISQTISTIPEAGRRGVDVQTQFVIKQEDFQDHLQGTTVSELNTLKTQINTTVTGINTAVETINTKVSEASTSASSASTSANTATIEASNASTSASNANVYSLKAGKWADNNYNVEVEAGKYSAKHWATEANNVVSGKADTSYVNGKYSGFKNYIINGNFDIWQYKDAGLPYPQTSSGYGSDDRWNNLSSGSTKTHSRVACTDIERALFNASYFSRTVVTSVAGSSNYCCKVQSIENVTRLAGKTITLSFWAKADSNKNIAIEFYQNFGTGGSPSSDIGVISSQLVSLTATWQKKTITATIPSIMGKTLGTNGVHTTLTFLDFWFDAGSSFNSRSANLGQQSGTFDIAQVQLEEGSVATPFEQRPIGLELSLCQRYYETSGNERIEELRNTTTGIRQYGAVRFMVEKRITPTIVVMNDTTMVAGTVCQDNGTPVSVTIYSSGNTGFRPQWDNTAGRFGATFHYTASAEL